MKLDAVPPTRKLPAPAELNTWPVGPPGTETGACAVAPVPLYTVDTFDAASDTQNGLVAEKEMPHGFLRLGSVTAARPGTSEMRLVCVTITLADAVAESRLTTSPLTRE